jgi:hypothetical protein
MRAFLKALRERNAIEGAPRSRLSRRTDWCILGLLLQAIEHRIEADARGNRHEDGGCELNLVGRHDGSGLRFKHTVSADPLRDEVGQADDESGDAAKQQ